MPGLPSNAVRRRDAERCTPRAFGAARDELWCRLRIVPRLGVALDRLAHAARLAQALGRSGKRLRLPRRDPATGQGSRLPAVPRGITAVTRTAGAGREP